MSDAAHATTGSAGLFEQFLEFAPDAIVGVDAGGQIVLVNAQTEALFGYTREELRGQPVEKLVPLRFRAAHPRHRYAYFAEPVTRPMGAGLELFGLRQDGTEFPAEISLSGIETDEGRLAIAAIRDISERHTAERARAFLAAIVSSSDDGIFGTDLDGAIISWNDGAERLYGYVADEVLGRHVSLLVPPDRRGEAENVQGRAASGAPVEHLETTRLRKDGRELTMSLTVSPIRDDRERIVGTATIARDISQEKAGQRTLEQFLEFAPDAFVGVDAVGKIVLVNAQTEALFGYARDELMGAPVELLIPERYHGAHPSHRRGYFADPVMRPMGVGLDLFGRRKDGTEFPAEISLSSIETEGGLLATATIRDVTERVESEHEQEALRAQLEESRRLEAAREREGLEAQLNQLRRLESVGQLAGGIAHDFNNILGVILNYSQFVAEEIGEGSPVADDVEEIRRAAERAAALTRQLLIFSRRDVVHPEVLDLNTVVSELDKLLRRVLGEHVELETRFAGGLPPVEADPGQLEQVLVNLAVNARDAMPGGGRLVVETSAADIDDSFDDMTAGRYVRLLVSDTGVGMSQDVAARVFEPFFSTKPKTEGTGLGLTTVYGIVTDAGGGIRIYSEPGLGTTFKVYLPACAGATRRRAAAPARAKHAANGERVLVVEDEESVRALTERILRRAGYEVVATANGREALEVCEREDETIDLMLTDVVMPEILGPVLAERAARIRPGLRVLFMSGYVHQAISQLEMTNPEELDVVEKPFTADELLTRVRSALDGRE